MSYSEYPSTLKEVKPGRPFFMLNYSGLYMKVVTDKNVFMFRGPYEKVNNPFSSVLPEQFVVVRAVDVHSMAEGSHLPIVNLTTGELTWMSDSKPIRIT